MQYSLAIIVFILVFAYLVYKVINYFHKTREIFIQFSQPLLKKVHIDNNCRYPFDEFESLWIALSKNLGCPKGKMIKNCNIGYLMESYPLPDMFVDDIFMDYEEYANFTLVKDMSFYDFVYSILDRKHNFHEVKSE